MISFRKLGSILFLTTSSITACKSSPKGQENIEYVIHPKNQRTQSRQTSCQGEGGTWIQYECYNTNARRKKSCESKEFSSWDSSSNQCVTDQIAQENDRCLSNGGILSDTCSQPAVICIDDQVFNGSRCVLKNSPANFFRLCVTSSRGRANEDEKKFVQSVKEALKIQNEDQDCKTIYDNLKKQTQLKIEGKGLKNLSALHDLEKLKFLYAQDNHIRNLDFLKNAKSIQRLDIRGNQLTSITPLETCCPNLESLKISGNPVDDMKKNGQYSCPKGSGSMALRQFCK